MSSAKKISAGQFWTASVHKNVMNYFTDYVTTNITRMYPHDHGVKSLQVGEAKSEKNRLRKKSTLR